MCTINVVSTCKEKHSVGPHIWSIYHLLFFSIMYCINFQKILLFYRMTLSVVEFSQETEILKAGFTPTRVRTTLHHHSWSLPMPSLEKWILILKKNLLVCVLYWHFHLYSNIFRRKLTFFS